MTKEHKIRMAVAHLTGTRRDETIIECLRNPVHLRELLSWRLQRATRVAENGHKSAKHTPRQTYVHWAMRLTPDDYLKLRDAAGKRQMSMAALIRHYIRKS